MSERVKELAAIGRKITKIDPVFGPAIKNYAKCTFGVDKPRETHYQSLLRAVIAQQVSGAAARTIGGRLKESCGGSITASRVGALTLSELQSVGLTGAKVRTIDELTQATLAGDVNFKRFPYLADHEIMEELVPLFGIGRWTVEMFLIFQLGRLDVWPVGDLAVRRGWDLLHKNLDPIKPKELDRLGEQFAGMRSVVAWYCWRAS